MCEYVKVEEVKLTPDQIKAYYNDCCKCSDPLQYAYMIDYVQHKIIESGTCYRCGIRFDPQKFILH